MSLSALLLGSGKKDTGLDALFTEKAAPTPPTPIAVAGPSQKRKSLPEPEIVEPKKRKVEKKKKEKSKPKPKAPTPDSSDDEGVEDAYEKNQQSDSDEEGDPSTLVHESVTQKSNAPKAKKKTAPPEETTEQRDLRTLFIGNLPVEVAQKKSSTKQLKRHILSFASSSQVESIRFRSVAFKTPTSNLPDDDDPKNAKKGKKEKGRAHDKARVNAWKSDNDQDVADEKKFLTPAQKKRIAFINQDFHTTADSVNAYVVLAYEEDVYDATPAIAKKANGSTFMDRILRVDVVGKPDGGEPKLSVFVGSVDFAAKDEDLRAYFEALLTAERGGPPEGDGARWVTRVRIVRDRETQLGKGFAYVQFADVECVDEVVAMEEGKIRFAKRKLRVARCKSTTKSHMNKPAPNASSTSTPAIVRTKGDPMLGAKIAHLSKDERKSAKSADADRVARRLAKKKSRHAMDKDNAIPVKMRDRSRKKPSHGKKPNSSAPKKRVRSDASIMKKNKKKAD
ncbi:hypothetical protein CYLTODRAFT_381221 [Cylindrobasidium torrendii FP15055 ss-10]|uniref:Nucleolar protein 12 n=1 Tax=Cylindrobasidium torrendii FP15055 ss-10 TaxID=1314674 RepID=A0A0D7B0Z3_9AGAR|nr:hypothetical protein CYLTODRAFT_381221 [Cylindrobasidium torrendii FP15055 ss-10]